MKGALLAYEPLVLAALVLCALLLPRFGARWWSRLAKLLDQVGRRPAVAVAVTALLAAAGSGVVASLVQWPEPNIHDEFSYLLAADTFAHGRLSNPTHPHWEHFETYHVIHTPSYMSKYPPAQGLVLAVGQLLGHPAVGLWLSAALMCGAFTWMLLGWLPARWAMLGGLLGLLRFGVTTYWTQSYWGGALTAAGGALVFGAMLRVMQRRRTRDAVLMALGLGLLANCRPWEGLVTSLPVMAVLLVWFLRLPRNQTAAVWRHLIAPVVLVMGLILGAMAVNNQAITGHVLTMPYQVHDAEYSPPPPFLWSELPASVDYRHAPMREFWREIYLDEFERKRTPAGFLEAVGQRAHNLWSFYAGWLLLLPLLASSLCWRRRRVRFAAACVLMLFVVLTASTYYGRHYFAPVTALVVLLVATGCRQLGAWRLKGRPVGRALVLGLLLCCCVRLAAHVAVAPLPATAWSLRRAGMLAELTAEPGMDLVIVRYGAHHDTSQEWVANGADLVHGEVLWARDLGEQANRELMAADPERKVWLLLAGYPGEHDRLQAYPEAAAPSRPAGDR